MTAQLHIFRVVLVTVVLLSTCLLSGQTNSPQASAPSSQKAPDTTDKDIDLLR
jgi:hypothetical protein